MSGTVYVACQKCTTWISSSWTQLQHNYYNIKRALYCICHNGFSQAHAISQRHLIQVSMHIHYARVGAETTTCKLCILKFVLKVNTSQLLGWRICTDKTLVVN